MSAQGYPQRNQQKNKLQLQLLLFVDERVVHQDGIKQVKDYLAELHEEHDFFLEVINIKEQPQLVEHYRLVATPSLVKVFPEPLQIFAGSNILPGVERWWSQWQEYLIVLQAEMCSGTDSSLAPLSMSDRRSSANEDQGKDPSEKMQLIDEIFQLEREKKELLKQIQFKDQLLAMLAHDLRSPLTGASIAIETLEILANRPDTDKNHNIRMQLYKQARSQLQIMNSMITELLQESRQLSTKLEVDPQPIALTDLCRQIESQMRQRFQQKSMRLILDIPSDLPEVYGDKELIQQVIVNLLDNAIKYSPEQSWVRLVGLHRTIQQVQISVIDQGDGIPALKQDQIFEGNFRLKRDSAKEGYGLGLAVCRQIIQAHYGRIWVDSTEGHGSTFHFTLPVRTARLTE